MFNVPLIYTAC